VINGKADPATGTADGIEGAAGLVGVDGSVGAGIEGADGSAVVQPATVNAAPEVRRNCRRDQTISNPLRPNDFPFT
jgi:hypothetical protein